MLQARVYGMIENIGGGYLILRDTRTDDDDDIIISKDLNV